MKELLNGNRSLWLCDVSIDERIYFGEGDCVSSYLDKAESWDFLLDDTVCQGWICNPDAFEIKVKLRMFIYPVCNIRDVFGYTS